MKKTLCYIVSESPINYFRDKTMGNNGYMQVWKVYGKVDSRDRLKDVWDIGYQCNLKSTDKFLSKTEHYGKPVLFEGKDDEEIKKLVESRFYW